VLRAQGLRTACTSTLGVEVDGQRLMDGDCTGYWSGRSVLTDPDVDAAVLETARGGILRRGLCYDRSDVAVVLNISADHLGQDGVETLDELAAVKAVVADTARRALVLNAEDQRCVAMAAQARDAYNAGASIMHVHIRAQEPGMGHMPSWDPEVAQEVVDAIRAACPGVVINLTTGVIGKDISGPLACIRRVRPEIAACNAGSLNYLKIKEDGNWAWPPMVFDNPVAKVQQFLDVMEECGTHPEFECFDVGIVRSVTMFIKNGMLKPSMGRPEYNLVMGVASGMPCDARLLELLPQWMAPGAVWQATHRTSTPSCSRKP